MLYCREIDSDGDEVDDDINYHRESTAAAAAAGDDVSINYYVWYAVDIDVSPAQPHDTLTVSSPCLVSQLE